MLTALWKNIAVIKQIEEELNLPDERKQIDNSFNYI
jgi:hypothetical protein